ALGAQPRIPIGSGDCGMAIHNALLRMSMLATVYGAVININRGNLAGHEVLRWHWMTDFYTNMNAAFHQDLVAYQALLGSTGSISWGQAFRIHELDSAMWETSRDESLSNLRNKTWPHGGTEQSWQYLANLIHHFPSFCLLDATDHPVSWSLMDPFGAMVHGYSLPQHRRHCYMQVLSTMTAKWTHPQGCSIFGHVALDNLPMQRLQESQGFQHQPSLCHHYPYPRASDGSQLSVLTQHQPPPPT
ncbi:unnamed protein product, partial [Caretta caretta]